ncbi:FliG C-terminal domain-containing protein [Yoonia sp. MH D7]
MNTSTLAPLSARTPALSRKRKAAMIVQLLIGDGGKLSLSQLPEEMQVLLARELGAIRLVDRETVHEVANEFARDLAAVGLSSPGGADGAIDALSAHLSPDLANRLRAELASAKNGDPWTMVLALPDDVLLSIMTRESPEVSAVALSKLTVMKAAMVLEKLPGDQARRITYAISQTEKIAPDAVRRIGAALVKEYCTRKAVAFDKAPVARVGAILNSSPALTRESVLEGLGSDDPVFADNVRKAIFTFKDIPNRLTPTDVPACIRGVEADVLSTAMAAALAGEPDFVASAEFILSNISQRMAGQIREDAAEKGTVKAKAAEDAMRALSSAIRELVDNGTITLISDDEDEAV